PSVFRRLCRRLLPMAEQLENYRTRRRAIFRRGADPERYADSAIYSAYSETRYRPDGRQRQPSIRCNGRDSMGAKAVLPVDAENAALCGPQLEQGPEGRVSEKWLPQT